MMKTKRTKIEKTLKELDDLYSFYRNIPKIREPEKAYKSVKKNVEHSPDKR